MRCAKNFSQEKNLSWTASLAMGSTRSPPYGSTTKGGCSIRDLPIIAQHFCGCRSVNGANFVYFGMQLRELGEESNPDPEILAMVQYAKAVISALGRKADLLLWS